MNIQAQFLSSNTTYKDCPKPDFPEYAFIGRSNVGKSSLINMITGNGSLAKVSGKPGKTQLINHFTVSNEWYLVDLPGYGWAKTSKDNKAKWEKMVRGYFLNRENLSCVFVLIDSRLEPQAIDLEFIEWLGTHQIPFVLVFTKTDKQTRNKTGTMIARFQNKLKETWDELPLSFITSAIKHEGKDELIKFIQKTNKKYKQA
jgi:GTP-binding protein